MNRLLADTLATLNVIVAVALIVMGVFVGYGWQHGIIGGLLGGGLAFLRSCSVCGGIAYLALIEGHLAEIASRRGLDGYSGSERRAPTL